MSLTCWAIRDGKATVFVCHCEVVTDREIRAAIDCGASDLCAIAARCGAGRTCGGCIPALLALLRERGHHDEARSARDIRDELRRGRRGPASAPAPAT